LIFLKIVWKYAMFYYYALKPQYTGEWGFAHCRWNHFIFGLQNARKCTI